MSKVWKLDEDNLLLKEIQEKKSIIEIADIHKRTQMSIYKRLLKLADEMHVKKVSITDIGVATGLSNEVILKHTSANDLKRKEAQDKLDAIIKEKERLAQEKLKKLEESQTKTEIEQRFEDVIITHTKGMSYLECTMIDYIKLLNTKLQEAVAEIKSLERRVSECEENSNNKYGY